MMPQSSNDTAPLRSENAPGYLGENGHGATFAVAAEAIKFDLSDADAMAILRDYNAGLSEQWREAELVHKFGGRKGGSRGRRRHGIRLKEIGKHSANDSYHAPTSRATPRTAAEDACDYRPIYDPSAPLAIARDIINRKYHHEDGPTIVYPDPFYQFQGAADAESKDAALRADIYAHLDAAQREEWIGKTLAVLPFKPKPKNVSDVIDALKGAAYSPLQSPTWIDGENQHRPDPTAVIVAKNGIVELRKDAPPRIYSRPTPLLFTLNALDFDFVPDASSPAEWLKFLKAVWPDDAQAIQTLREWFGYCIVSNTAQQKMILLCGPKRAGKGTIARTLTKLVGINNVGAPTLAGLGTNFGLWSLIGKQLAIIGDARLSGRSDQAVVTEPLLSLTGEDAITVDRKNLQPITLRLLARLMILTNELPKLADASGALASRFIVLMLRESFYGRRGHPP